MALYIGVLSSRPPEQLLGAGFHRHGCKRRHGLTVARSSGDEDPVSKFLREHPPRIERKALVDGKLYTMTEWRRVQIPRLFRKAPEKQQQDEGPERDDVLAEGGKPVYLRNLLREFKGDLYVPEEAFMGEEAQRERFDKEFEGLPIMLLEDFLKNAESNQIARLVSKGTKFIVQLKEYPGEMEARKWAMHLTEAEARDALAQYRGYHHEIQPRFTPVVVQPPPTPNPVAAAISGRLMVEFSTVVSLTLMAVYSTSKLLYGIAGSVVRSFKFFGKRILLPLLSPLTGPLISLGWAIWDLIIGTSEEGARKGIVGLFSGVFAFLKNGSVFAGLKAIAAMIFVVAVLAALAKFTLTRRSRDHQKWDIWQAIEFAFSKPQARVKSTGVKFSDVAGIEDIVAELKELVDYLKNEDKYAKMGTKPPHGVLLEGPPGCGKTLLAKAIAGEAGVPFYQMAGSEFVEVLVGVGAARMRDLFKRAKVNKPAVVFIDEIDALGGARSVSGRKDDDTDRDGKANSGMQERETTLNQLLIELDGFDTGKRVIFLGATNRADMLDPALLRPGRFDRRILIRPPKAEARYAIMKVHAAKVSLDKSVDLWPYAKNLSGWGGAQLAQLIQEAALIAARRNHKSLTSHDLDTAIDRLLVGPETPGVGRRQSIHRRLATVEIGMSIVAHLLRVQENSEIEPCERISIVPRGMTYARSIYDRLDDEAYMFARRPTMIHRMKVFFGARLAEEIVYGRETSSLSATYLADASWLARKIYTIWNMDGPISMHGESPPWERHTRLGPPLGFEGELYDDYGLVGSKLNADVDEVVVRKTKELVEKTYSETASLLAPYKAAVFKALHVVMDKEELFGYELDAILDHYRAGYPVALVEAEREPGSMEFVGTQQLVGEPVSR